MAVSVISMAIGGYSGGCHLSFSNFSCQPGAESERSDSIIKRLSEQPFTNYVTHKGFLLLDFPCKIGILVHFVPFDYNFCYFEHFN